MLAKQICLVGCMLYMTYSLAELDQEGSFNTILATATAAYATARLASSYLRINLFPANLLPNLVWIPPGANANATNQPARPRAVVSRNQNGALIYLMNNPKRELSNECILIPAHSKMLNSR